MKVSVVAWSASEFTSKFGRDPWTASASIHRQRSSPPQTSTQQHDTTQTLKHGSTMATEGVVIADATDATPTIGTLFSGKSFLVQQRVPQRNSFLERIRANGGRIVRLELQADYIIADHMRKDCPPTSLSYTFVEAAIRNGAIPDINDHRAGPAPGAIRAIGSSAVPAKATRTPFTPQDDRDVCNWVNKCQQEGQAVKGYEIYKQLEAINPRHTFQSWRDHYIKKLMNNPPQGVAPLQTPTYQPPPIQAAAPHIPTVDGSVESRPLAAGEQAQENGQEEAEQSAPEGTLNEDICFLEENIQDIIDVPSDDHRVMWESLADMPQCNHLTAVEWQRLYEDTVLPAYMARKKQENASQQKAQAVTPKPPRLRAPPRTSEVGAARFPAANGSQTMPSRGPIRLVSPELVQDDEEDEEPPTTPELVARKLKAAQRNKATSSQQEVRPATPELPQDSERLATPELIAMKLQAATASQALPSGTRKRSRETSTPQTNVHERKRVKADGSDLFTNGEPANARVPTADMGLPGTAGSMANLGEDTEMVNGGHVANRLLPSDDALPTSELNRAAKAQLIAEAAQEGDGSAVEANGTEMQLNDATTPKPRVKAISLIDQTDSQEAGIISPSNIDSPDEVGVLNEVLPAQGLQLTEENLASQQAEHGVKPTRAVDLREDDKDLEGYATYLQKLLIRQESTELAKRSNKAAEDSGQHIAELDPELESDRELSPEDEQQAAAANGDFDFADSADKNGAGGIELSADASQDVDMEGDIDLSLAEPEGGFGFSSQDMDGQQKPDEHQWEPRSVPQIKHANAEIVMSSNSASRETSDPPEDEQMGEVPARALAQNVLDTQDIYEAGAQQQPDFSFPLPPELDSQQSEAEPPRSQPAKAKPAPAQQQRRQSTRKPASKPATPQKAPTPRKQQKQPRSQPAQSTPSNEPLQEAAEEIPAFIHRLTTVKGCSPASVQNALYRTSAQLQAAELVAMYEKLGLPAPDIPELWTERDDAMLASMDGRVLKQLAERKGWAEYEVRDRFLKEWNAS
jgi:hypothetical protein